MKKKIFIILICLLCIIPIILIPAGVLTIKSGGGPSNMGVIIGPIVGLDDVLIDQPATNEWSSSTGVSRNTPYTDGSLRSYTSLYVVNDKFNTDYGGWKHASFVKFLKIVRNDGRPIYDDDGVLDVAFWSNGNFGYSDEIVDYSADLYVRTQIMPYSWGGFLGTVLNAKFQSGAYFNITWGGNEDPWDGQDISIHDKNANNMGSGNYRNNGVNPGPEYYKLCDFNWCNAPYVYVDVCGTGYWENGWWGGSGSQTKVSAFISGFMARANRNWSNNLSVNSYAGVGTYNGKTAYYSPKNYTVVATNLNNYVKLDGVQATPQSGTSVSPFKDGHHIVISKEGYTYVEIENGSENVYTPYYCFVDSTLPDINLSYHNSNATEKRTVGGITTNANGSKSQTTFAGVFRDQVQVNFGADLSNESPENATYTFNGQTKSFTSGTWFNDEGNYTINVTDLAGNSTTYKFTIDKSYPNYNLNRLQTSTNYKISKWYLTSIPYGYTGYGTYSFADYNDAFVFAQQSEFNNKVTSYNLTNINDFNDTHLVANGNTVKVGEYWYYKSRENPNLYVYYFDYGSLSAVIEHYSEGYVSGPEYYKYNSNIYPNNYGNTIDSSVIDNTIDVNGIETYIVNNFAFRYSNDNETYKIYYDYQEDSSENWKEFSYGVLFENQVSSHGLYKIKERDFVGHETTYYVFLDKQAPTVEIGAKFYGKNNTITQTISVNDIPNNNELIFYYENFEIKEIIEDDEWWVLEVRCPNGTTNRYTYLDELPDFTTLGSGEFTINLVDRMNNKFTFKVCLLGQAPTVDFKVLNANTEMKVTITTGENYNTLTNLQIYRNGVCLNSEYGYDEQPNNDESELIFINTETLSYLFKRGGIYVVELTDNFGRTLSYEYKFEKDLPTGILVGVEHNGKTKSEVQFIFDSNKYFVTVNKNDNIYTPTQTTDSNGRMVTLYFNPEENTQDQFKIYLYDLGDTENYNFYYFTIKTIKPIINLYGVEPNGTTGGDVFAIWEVNEEQYTAIYSLNGTQNEYKKGQVLTVGGTYSITLTDEIGNSNTVYFSIDKTINFTIADNNGNTYRIEQIRYINFDIRFIEDEPLTIIITKNEEEFDYEFNSVISEEALYTVRIFDIFNNSEFFTFTIDKTAPIAILHNVENYGITNQNVWISSDEPNLVCWYMFNGEYGDEYELSTEIRNTGKYIVYVSDLARNYISFEFEIDKVISFNINTYYGGIANGNVRIIAYENLQIVMLKNGKSFEYNFEDIINDEGEYSFTMTDNLNNRQSFFFNIINKRKQNLKHLLQEEISISEVIKDEEIFDFTISEGSLYLYDEGTYTVKVHSGKDDKDYLFDITIDTTAPTLELVNVDNGGSTKNIISTRNLSETPVEFITYCDGLKFEYEYGKDIEKCGRFTMTLVDEAGNENEYTFEKIYTLNGASITLLAGMLALVVVLIALLIKSRHHYYVEETIEETTEETIIDDDSNDNNINNSNETTDS